MEFRLEPGQVLEVDQLGPSRMRIDEEDLANLEVAGTIRGNDGSAFVRLREKKTSTQAEMSRR